MKVQSYLLKAGSLLLVAALFLLQHAVAQDSKKAKDSIKEASVKTMLAEQRFVFNVQSVTPMKGGTRQLSPGYTLSITKDTIVSELPYFGRMYQATISNSDGGIKFTSTDFSYTSNPRKKGGWEIVIKPKENISVQEMYLTVFENGNASLNINCKDRQPVSFNGEIDAKQSK